MHFKDPFALDGKHANLTVNDVQRRNRITRLLADWGLITIVKEDAVMDIAPLIKLKSLHIRINLIGSLSKSTTSERKVSNKKVNETVKRHRYRDKKNFKPEH